MAIFDLPYAELISYCPEIEAPADFDAFWETTLSEARRVPLEASFNRVDYGLALQESYDVTFHGFGGQPVKAWLMVPTQRQEPLPCIVEYIGYGGGRGYPIDWLLWSSCGYAHLIMDTRGQGSSWLPGDTPDIETGPSNPQYPGFMTRGILDPHNYYYRRLITDAVRAVECARSFPGIDPQRIAVNGGSQGGALALSTTALDPTIPVCMADVPFLCHFRRATELVDTFPYHEIALYCKVHRDKVDQVFTTLSYFDGVNMAPRAKAHALFSTALMDQTCPPSTVFAAYNHYQGPKEIKVWEFNEHEGGKSYQDLEKIRFLKRVWEA